MLARQVSVAPHHLRALPRTQLLQYMQRSPGLHMPARPRMPQIVPAEILDLAVLTPILQAVISSTRHQPHTLVSRIGVACIRSPPCYMHWDSATHGCAMPIIIAMTKKMPPIPP